MTPTHREVWFVTLRMFSAIGGIEKFNRSFSYALGINQHAVDARVKVFSLYDNNNSVDTRYTSQVVFKGFAGNKIAGMLYLLRNLSKCELLILGHVNLGLLAFAASIFHPKIKRVLIGHGVEVWEPVKWWQKGGMKWFSQHWVVSNFTRQRLQQFTDTASIKILYNTLDPFFSKDSWQASTLEKRLGFNLTPPIMLTVARIQNSEQQKGYDQVLALMPKLLEQFPKLTYVLAGPAKKDEVGRLLNLAHSLKISSTHLRFTGQLPQEALNSLYASIPVFVMPSGKEGFGIVYIEAAWCGSQVIASRQGGAVEALLDGKLGILVPPDQPETLLEAIGSALRKQNNESRKLEQKNLVEEQFGFDQFTQRQALLLKNILA